MCVARPSFVRISALLCSTVALIAGISRAQIPSQAQPRADTRANKDYGYSGQLSLQVQDATGEAFFGGATVALLVRDTNAHQPMRATSDVNGQARFAALPVGIYVMEITAPGYRTIQQQVIVTGTREAQNLVVTMVPVAVTGKVRIGSVSVASKAVTETDKALRAMQANRFNEAQRHLALALAAQPNFADGNYLMGLVFLRQKDSAKARAYLKRSIELAPEHTAALLALGEAEYLERDYAHGAESLAKFLEAAPHSPQAPVARKYVDAMRKVLPAAAGGDGAGSAGNSDGAMPGGSPASGSDGRLAIDDLPALAELAPATESSWAPPDVDDEKLDLDRSGGCQVDEVVKAAGRRMQELVANVNRFTATENLQHMKLSPMGVEVSHESRKYKYVAEIRPLGNSDMEVEEYRTGSAVERDFPDGIATIGLSSLAMIFHPNLAGRYEFRCDGRGTWGGRATWVVHFQQRRDESRGMLTYNVAGRYVSVGLRGRGWIDVNNRQILAMESDIVQPVPEIRLKRDHQLIEYGPVTFKKNATELWLPKSADWYCSISGKRFHRRHTFSQFLLFSVDDRQKINNPTVEPE